MKKQHVHLTETDREYLESLLKQGNLAAREYRRALSLLELDRGKTYLAVAESIGVTDETLALWSRNYRAHGLKCLQDKARPGRPIEIAGEQRAKITALACSQPPPGYARWSLRLLADKIVELELCEHISHTEVRTILKKTSCNRI